MKVLSLLVQMADKLLDGWCIHSSSRKKITWKKKKKPPAKKFKYEGGARTEILSKSSSFKFTFHANDFYMFLLLRSVPKFKGLLTSFK